MSKANDTQIAGDHYRSGLQPWDVFLELYGLSFLMCNAAKYLVRWRKKNGLEDLKKARHCIQKTMEVAEDGRVQNPCLYSVGNHHVLDTIARMGKENAIPDTEFSIIDLVLRWSRKEHLDQALMLLEGLIVQEGGTLD